MTRPAIFTAVAMVVCYAVGREVSYEVGYTDGRQSLPLACTTHQTTVNHGTLWPNPREVPRLGLPKADTIPDSVKVRR